MTVFVTCMLYIVGVSYYNKHVGTVSSLYKAVNIKDITYEEVKVNIMGTTENENISDKVMRLREQECEEVFSNLGEDNYTYSIKSKERYPEIINYHMEIQGLGNIDEMKKEGIKLFDKWGVTSKEYISFTGYVEGKLSKEEKEAYVEQILKSLNGYMVDYYEDDMNASTKAYYGYTPDVKSFITMSHERKSNVQVTFVYNELLDKEEIIIAFPFFNNPY